MPQAVILDVCDAVADRIRENLDVPGSATVSREYVTDDNADRIDGRVVYVFPARTANLGPVNRAEDLKGYTASIVVAERFTGQGPATRDWIDALMLWVETQVFDRVEDVRPFGKLLGRFWPAESQWIHYEPAWLLNNKLFWSEINVEFREEA